MQGKYFRLSQEANDAIKRLVDHFKKSQNEVVDKLLRWSSHQDLDQLEVIFLDGRLDLLNEVANYVHDLAWGEHSFHAGQDFATWCLQEYYRANKRSKPGTGIYQFTSYRIAYSWAQMARLFRSMALKQLEGKVDDQNPVAHEDWKKLFQLADECLCLAVAHNEAFLHLRTHPVVRYNIACEHAMRGQFFAEYSLLGLTKTEKKRSSPSKTNKWANELLSLLQASNTQDGAVERLCREWREHFDEDTAARVNQCAFECINHLKQLINDAMSDDQWIDVSFFWRHAGSKDVDLSLVKHHPQYSNDFQEWSGLLARHGLPDVFQKLASFGKKDEFVANRLKDVAKIFQS
jgi:hypothetical protein